MDRGLRAKPSYPLPETPAIPAIRLLPFIPDVPDIRLIRLGVWGFWFGVQGLGDGVKRMPWQHGRRVTRSQSPESPTPHTRIPKPEARNPIGARMFQSQRLRLALGVTETVTVGFGGRCRFYLYFRREPKRHLLNHDTLLGTNCLIERVSAD